MEHETETVETQGQQPNNNPPSPPPPPSPPSIDNSGMVALLQENARAERLERERLQKELDEVRRQQQTPPKSPEDEQKEFYANPLSVIRNEIQTQLKETIAPLLEFTKSFQAETAYDKHKKTLKADGRFSKYFPSIEPLLDQLCSSIDTSSLNNVQGALLAAIGMQQSGMWKGNEVEQIPTPEPTPTPNPAPTNVINPPHLRPNPPAPPTRQDNKPTRRALTENERRLMRENGFKNEEEYWRWMEMPAQDVAFYKGDKEQPK